MSKAAFEVRLFKVTRDVEVHTILNTHSLINSLVYMGQTSKQQINNLKQVHSIPLFIKNPLCRAWPELKA